VIGLLLSLGSHWSLFMVYKVSEVPPKPHGEVRGIWDLNALRRGRWISTPSIFGRHPGRRCEEHYGTVAAAA